MAEAKAAPSEQVLALYNGGDLEGALAQALELLKASPGNAALLHLAGKAAVELGRDDGVTQLEQAVAADPDNPTRCATSRMHCLRRVVSKMPSVRSSSSSSCSRATQRRSSTWRTPSTRRDASRRPSHTSRKPSSTTSATFRHCAVSSACTARPGGSTRRSRPAAE